MMVGRGSADLRFNRAAEGRVAVEVLGLTGWLGAVVERDQ